MQWNLWSATVPERDDTLLNTEAVLVDLIFSLFSSSGLLVAYCHRFDILTQTSRIYFVACTIGTYVCMGSGEGYKCMNKNDRLHDLRHDWTLTVSLSCFVFSLRHRPAHHVRGSGHDANGSAGTALPGALHSAHQPRCSAVAQGVAPVLDWKWICGEYQFDMTAYCGRTKKDF